MELYALPARHPWRRRVMVLVGIFAAYAAVGLTGVLFYDNFKDIPPAAIWPPLGIAIAAVIVFGYEALAPIAVGAFLIALVSGAGWYFTIYATIANTLQALAAALIVRFFRIDPALETIRDVSIVVGSSLLATMIIPTMRVSAVLIFNYLYGAALPIAWWTWWVGGALSVLTFTPLFLVLMMRPPNEWIRPAPEKLRWALFEMAIAFVVLVTITIRLAKLLFPESAELFNCFIRKTHVATLSFLQPV